MFVLIPLGVAILAGTIYLAISKRSSFILRIAALGALALMILSVIICLFIIFGGKSDPETFVLPDALPSEVPPSSEPNIAAVIMIIIFLIALFLLVLIISLREQKRKANAEKEVDRW
jgi:ABC-type Fe3+ transport system permease subunit